MNVTDADRESAMRLKVTYDRKYAGLPPVTIHFDVPQIEVIATAIAQARVDAEWERDEARTERDKAVGDSNDWQAACEMVKVDRDALAARVEALRKALEVIQRHRPMISTHELEDWQATVGMLQTHADAALAATPAASLIAHDNALIERWREAADEHLSAVGPLPVLPGELNEDWKRGVEHGVAACRRALHALKTDSEGSTT